MFRRRRGVGSGSDPMDDRAVFVGLRGQLVSGDPGTFGMAPSVRLPRVWGVLFEQGMRDSVATVVSLADGTTSLYTSAGGGVIGGSAHPGAVEATMRFLEVVEASLELTTPSDELPLPLPEEVRFNVLTYDGPRTASARQAELGDHAHPLRLLWLPAHGVVTQLRLISERPSSPQA